MSNATSASVVYLVDAYAMIYRAYFAFIRAPRVNAAGLNTSPIFGFVTLFADMVLKARPSHVAVAFDVHGPTFREELFPDYKANRDAQPEDITAAIPYIKRFIQAMRIPMAQLQGFEADDIIGTLSRRFAEQGAKVIMATPDKDYAQLVTPSVSMLRPSSSATSGHELLDVQGVCAKYGIAEPAQMIDILGLWGDTADNIPGCKGVGEKRAKELIAAYGSIDGIYQHIDELKGALQRNLIECREQVMLSRKLATIVTDAPIDLSLDEVAAAEPDWDALSALFDELDMKGMISRLRSALDPTYVASSAAKSATRPAADAAQPSLFDFAAPDAASAIAAEPLALQTAKSTPHTYKLLRTAAELDELCQTLLAAKAFCFDTETSALDAVSASMVGFSVAVKAGEAWFVRLPADKEEATALMAHVAPAFAAEGILKIGQNMKFDVMVLGRYGIEVRGPRFDTMIAHFLLCPSRRHNMDAMAEELLSYKPIAIEELIGSGAKQGSMADVPDDLITEYAAEDADVTFRLYEVLAPRIEQDADIAKLFNDIEMPLVQVLADMEMAGVALDSQELASYSDFLRKRIAEYEAKVREVAGYDINVASPKQIGELLFDRLKLDDKAKKTKTGSYATNEETLQKLSAAHPVVGDILAYRGLVKLLGTYAEALPKLVNPVTGRLHTSFNQTVVVTGRLSSSNPNLQNIPVRDDDGKRVRACFVAKPGHKILAADYSQVELRLMAHFSQDEHMLEAFRRGDDIHRATAAKVYGVAPDEVTSDMRRRAKTANFGIIYGISAFGLADRLEIPRKEAKELIDGYFQNFPGVKGYMDSCIAQARESLVVRTLFGRKRELPDIASRNATVRGVAERNAINAPIQGTAADIIKIAMINVHKALAEGGFQAKMLLQVHDELVFEVPDGEVDAVAELVKAQMEQACQVSVPLTAEVGIGDNWLQAH